MGHLCNVFNKQLIMYEDPKMKMFFYTVSVLMIIAWALSYFVYSLQPAVHLLLLLAVVVGLIGMKKND
ncbi:hypothetical protein BXY82_1069 [Gelidibacter sediminis]|uniref:Uncharacterized protein n=1 Tax=Gelidibacter sediminis TaxID=1608710 RepID=A0A4R7Q7M3_9FLAO|nr:hypothetical protein BXY82_1069 [Gelidibacter sediminis]